MTELLQLENLGIRIRRRIIDMADYCGGDSAHWGGSLSIVDVLAVLFGCTMRIPELDYCNTDYDKIILSKGHAGMALYASMCEVGLISDVQLKSFGKAGSSLGHLSSFSSELGIECSGGSLGIGLPYGVGMALLAKQEEYAYRTFVIVGDGEMDEGANWEAALCASKYMLDNLVLIIDRNGLQSDGSCKEVLPTDNLAEKLRSFGWIASEVDGHDYAALSEAISAPAFRKPYAIVAHTVKGKGISFMEGNNVWHDSPLTGDNLALAKSEVYR